MTKTTETNKTAATNPERTVATWRARNQIVAELFERDGIYTAVGYYPPWTSNWMDQSVSTGWKSEKSGRRAINSRLRQIGATEAVEVPTAL